MEISNKIYLRLLKYLDDVLLIEKRDSVGNQYQCNCLDKVFEQYKFKDEYLNLNDYLNEKADVDFRDSSFEKAYKNLEQKNRNKFIIALYNIFYFSDKDEKIKQKLYSFFKRQNIIFDGDLKYKKPLNIKKIGEGSYADVISINEVLVYKQLKHEYWNNKDILSRFKNEYKIQKKLKENLLFLNVYDYDEVENKYTMERGECNLFDFLEKNKNILDKKGKIEIIFRILKVMSYAHNQGIIHRDLHIGNILKKENDFFIVDFGFAKDEHMLRSRMTSSSKKLIHLFSAPEGLKSIKELDKFSDIYSLGRIIDYIMSDDLSFEGNHDFKYIVAKCCNRNKLSRYSSIDEIIISIKEKLTQRLDEKNQKRIIETIDNNNVNPEVEEFLSKQINSNNLVTVIYENSWRNFHEIILKIEDQNMKLKIIDHLYNDGVLSTRSNQWSDYSILGQIAYNLLITNEFDTKEEIKLCEILNQCSNRFDVQDLIRNVGINYNTKLREKKLEIF